MPAVRMITQRRASYAKTRILRVLRTTAASRRLIPSSSSPPHLAPSARQAPGHGGGSPPRGGSPPPSRARWAPPPPPPPRPAAAPRGLRGGPTGRRREELAGRLKEEEEEEEDNVSDLAALRRSSFRSLLSAHLLGRAPRTRPPGGAHTRPSRRAAVRSPNFGTSVGLSRALVVLRHQGAWRPPRSQTVLTGLWG